VWLALLMYAGFAVAAVLVVSRALDDDAPSRETTDDGAADGAAATGEGGSDQLTLQSFGARAQRSTVGVGPGTGFVAWKSNGLTLVMTSRPARGWRTGADRAIPVRYGSDTYEGTLVRVDPASGLGLVRITDPGVAEPLWQRGEPTRVRAGDLVVLVGRSSSRTVAVERVGSKRIYFAATGLAEFAGAPVLDESGRVVAVVDKGGGGTPIARACGVIRRC
jgi:hypothetical protein